MTTSKRIFTNTAKQVNRSGWLATGSIIVMALAFFIGTIFLFLAYASNLFIQTLENKPHIYLFFNPGTAEEEINVVKDKLNQLPEIYFIEYTSEEDAYYEFKTDQEKKDPKLAANIRENVLPASLGIRLNKITDADKIIDVLIQEKTNNEHIKDVRFIKETIEMFKNLFMWLRIGGGLVIGILMVVIFLFTLLTVEFRTYNRAEEISIMQLVGGSLWFIRAPFILEGAFYGFIGALISNIIIFGSYFLIFVVNKTSAEVNYLMSVIPSLNWPTFTELHFVALFFIILILGTLIGAFNSLVAIKRYIY